MNDVREISIKDRLCSIYHDTRYVKEYFTYLRDFLPSSFSIVRSVNRRSGCWYNPVLLDHGDAENLSEEVYFKSTDGHFGKWDFSFTRLNMRLLDRISTTNNPVVVIIDITRAGKRYPDSLSKTIPIWCCVINRTINKMNGADASESLDESLYVLPSVVSASEKSQIEMLLDSMANRLLEFVMTMPDMKMTFLDFGKRMKPLRPLFVCQGSSLFYDHSDGQIDFKDTVWEFCTPIICLSASSCILPRYQALALKTNDNFTVSIPYRYVQGAADDEESWCRGCGYSAVWENMERFLLECITESEREELLESLAGAIISRPHSEDCFSLLSEFCIAIGDERCGSEICFRQFDLLICCAKELSGIITMKNEAGHIFINLCIPKGNNSQRMLLESFPKVFDEYMKLAAEGRKRVLIYGKAGNDRAVCIAMFLMLSCYPSRFTSVSGVIDKTAIKKALIYVQQHRSTALPCRANLKALNVHFMGRPE